MVARSSCTRSLGAWHAICAGFEALHGFTDDTFTGGVSQDEPRSLPAAVAACGAGTALPESLVQGARPTSMLASGRGSAARRMNLTACGNATVPERLDIIRRTTARMFLGAEYIFLSRPDLQLTTDRPRRLAS